MSTSIHSRLCRTMGERYEHRSQWRWGDLEHSKLPVPPSATADEVRWAELRLLMGGATAAVASGGQVGLLRNLDKSEMMEGLAQREVVPQAFPLMDMSGTTTVIVESGCDYGRPIVSTADLAPYEAYFPQVAEGIDAAAHNEFVCLGPANPEHNVLFPRTALVHAVGLSARDFALVGRAGASVIWTPRTDLRLYGDTMMAVSAAMNRVTIALGTKWLPTGSMNMLRELRCADNINRVHWDSFFSDRDLWEMATINAAVVTKMGDVIGQIAPGRVADISIFNGYKNKHYRAVLDAAPRDVTLVMRGGKVIYGNTSMMAQLVNVDECDTMDVCGLSKSICLKGEIGKTLAELQGAGSGSYPLQFCSVPEGEPACVPRRERAVSGSSVYSGAVTASDTDGDGIENVFDNCPRHFNPIRPSDKGTQPDYDEDGAGDACDWGD